jgi:carbon-monoxide dehydrogenase medium subunit
MKSAKFDYVKATTILEAMNALEDPDTKILAGGQSLVPLLATREIRPGRLVDLRKVTELDYVVVRDDHVAIGAMTRHHTSETSPLLAELVPLIPMAVSRVAYPTVRNQGTAGGSLAHADYRAELPAVALTLDADLVVRSSQGERVIPASDFFLGDRETAISPDEILIEMRVPRSNVRYNWAMEEFNLRYRDFAIVAVYAGLTLGGDGLIESARLTVGATDPVAVRIRAAEEFLQGKTPTADAFEEASHLVGPFIHPEEDRFGTPEYKVNLATVLTERALSTAANIVGEKP